MAQPETLTSIVTIPLQLSLFSKKLILANQLSLLLPACYLLQNCPRSGRKKIAGKIVKTQLFSNQDTKLRSKAIGINYSTFRWKFLSSVFTRSIFLNYIISSICHANQYVQRGSGPPFSKF